MSYHLSTITNQMYLLFVDLLCDILAVVGKITLQAACVLSLNSASYLDHGRIDTILVKRNVGVIENRSISDSTGLQYF